MGDKPMVCRACREAMPDLNWDRPCPHWQEAPENVARLAAELEQMTAERDRLAGLYARELEAARTLYPGNSVGDITTVIGAKIRRLQEDLEERTLQHRVQLDNAVRLQDELFQAKRLMDGVREMARDRNPNGATILDFMAVWNEQYEKRIKTLTAELDQANASSRELNAAREEDGRRIVELEVDRDQLKTELDAIEAYVRANHNGYDPDAREAMPTLTQPATTLEAIRDLIDERRYLHSREVEMLEKDRDRWKAAAEVAMRQITDQALRSWGGVISMDVLEDKFPGIAQAIRKQEETTTPATESLRGVGPSHGRETPPGPVGDVGRYLADAAALAGTEEPAHADPLTHEERRERKDGPKCD